MTADELKRLLRDHGWVFDRETNHTVYRKEGSDLNVSVPNHKGDLGKGLVKSILKTAGIEHKP